MRNGNLLKSCVSKIHDKWIRVNQGVVVYQTSMIQVVSSINRSLEIGNSRSQGASLASHLLGLWWLQQTFAYSFFSPELDGDFGLLRNWTINLSVFFIIQMHTIYTVLNCEIIQVVSSINRSLEIGNSRSQGASLACSTSEVLVKFMLKKSTLTKE